MKQKYIWLSLVSGLVLAMTSCNKYLDVKPKGYQLLITVTDYDQWLNTSTLDASMPIELNYLADNLDNPNISSAPTQSTDLAYLWSAQLAPNLSSPAAILPNHYTSIYYFNTVIQGIDGATGGTAQQKASLKAEALLGRGLEYLYLVNEYGKEYDATTATTDLAVPFVTSNDLATATPPRSTVQQIYDQIIADITAAIPNLPADNSQNRYRGTIAAGYSVLARTYLYMRNYPMAQKYAQLALTNGPNAVLNYSTMADASAIPALTVRPDAIYARLATAFTLTQTPSLTFLRSFDKTDLRLKFYYTSLGDYSFPTRGLSAYDPYGVTNSSAYPSWGTSVAEMRLIIAEAAARSGDLATALQQLDAVRKCRFPTASYQVYQSDNAADVLQKILNERTFEFPYCGMRWFDMRRLDAENRMPAVVRYDAKNNVIATLAPQSPRYTLQIPTQAIYFNPGMPQNP
jgi:starch-binding outer membrane protein, SusD/RagB family